MTTTTTTYRYPVEADARDARRVLINKGVGVSLLALDPTTDEYVFDAYPNRVPCYCDSAYHPEGHPGITYTHTGFECGAL